MTGADAEQFTREREGDNFRQARDAQKWIGWRTSRKLTESGVHKLMHRPGRKLKVPCKSHRKSDQAASDAPKAKLQERVAEAVGPAPDESGRLWLLDKHRAGLLPLI